MYTPGSRANHRSCCKMLVFSSPAKAQVTPDSTLDWRAPGTDGQAVHRASVGVRVSSVRGRKAKDPVSPALIPVSGLGCEEREWLAHIFS